MDRRAFNQLFLAALAGGSLPQMAGAQTTHALVGAQADFLKALEEKPWLLGYLGSDEPLLQSDLRIEHGRVPEGLRGYFFRNGPARHNIGEDRFAHWFDAPGMVQRFTLSERGVHHLGRWVDTARNRAESAENRILFHGFGTGGDGLSSGGSADGQSTANISLLHHAGELLALWEGGSPHIIDPDTLETIGRKKWSEETAGLPFGAHPRRDSDGSIWNIGYAPGPGAIMIYHLSPSGALEKMHILAQPHTSMVHDFLITQTKLILVMPPFMATQKGDGSFLGQFEWRASDATEILVIDKSDLGRVTRLQTDAFWVFHFGNAYDISPTEIGFDFSWHSDPGFMVTDAFELMDGSWSQGGRTKMRYAQARLDLASRRVDIEQMDDHERVEFVQTDPRAALTRHRHALMLAHSDENVGQPGWDRLVLSDRLTGRSSSYQIGEGEFFEEHLIVPKSDSAEDFWIIGTSLNWLQAKTYLSVYEGRALGDGPVLRAAMDYPIPLGLHGMFKAMG